MAGEARVGIRGMGGRLFVAHVHDGDPFVEAAVVDGQDVAAAEGEDVADARLRQGARDQMPAREIRHGAAS
jgi:hypothetical protein